MALTSLSDLELLNLIKEKSKQERNLTLEVINLIREVEKRRLFLKLNFGSLFEYVTKELGFEESAANRRISASRLIREFPEAEEEIRDGSLTLSNIVQAQVFIRREEKLKSKGLPREEKKKVMDLVKNKSARNAKITLLQKFPEQVILNESTRQVTADHIEVKVILNEKVISKLDKLRGLLSHKHPNMSYSELIDELTNMAIRKLDPVEKGSRTASRRNATLTVKELDPTKNESQRNTIKVKSSLPPLSEIEGPDVQRLRTPASAVESSDVQKSKTPTSAVEQSNKQSSRYITSAVKRAVWRRDKGQCVFKESENHERCGSRFQLEYHHEIPFAKGGQPLAENIKLYCKRHNIHRAITDFGKEIMQEFTPGSVT